MLKKIGLCELVAFSCLILGGFMTELNEDIAVIIMLLSLLTFIIGPIIIILKSKKKTISKTNTRTDKLEKQEIENIWIKPHKNLWINEKERKIKINNNNYDFSQIIDYELLIDGSSISKANLGSVATRSLLFGVIGGTTAKRTETNYCSQLELKITVNNLSKPTEYINFMDGFRKINKNTIIYKKISKKAEDCISILKIITKK